MRCLYPTLLQSPASPTSGSNHLRDMLPESPDPVALSVFCRYAGFVPTAIEKARRRSRPASERTGRRQPEPPVRMDDFGLDEKFFLDYLEPLLEFFYTNWFRVEVEGLENVPSSGPALLVANHSGAIPFDGPMIRQAIYRDHPAHRHVRYLVLKWLCSTPFTAPLIQKMGFVLACRQNARALLQAGELVGVFPEGDKGTAKLFRDRYNLVRFGRGGFAEMALEAEAPIIPIAVVGGEETYPILMHMNPVA